jgi:O-antigen ligase
MVCRYGESRDCGLREAAMNARSSRIAVSVVAGLGFLAVLVFAYVQPRSFSDFRYLGALLGLQVILVCLWYYDVIFFPLLMVLFLWAGMEVPFSTLGRTARWLALAVAAFAGFVIWMRDRRHTFGLFHLVALSCVVTAFASAIVSADPNTSLLKVLSLFLLFLYGATGARLAIRGREVEFAQNVLLVCEIIVYFSAMAYLGIGWHIFGNPNSLGAIMGVVVTPLLFWGVLVARNPTQRYRRLVALSLSGVLLYAAMSRASLLAAAIAVAVLCVSLRRQRLLVVGIFVVALLGATAAVVDPEHFNRFAETETSAILYKGKREEGVLGSRRTPWQHAVEVIKEHPWLGSGFGTSYMGQFAQQRRTEFDPSSGGLYTKVGTNREHGNSYLALAEYMGLLGIIPFAILVFLIAQMVFRICVWMRRTSNPHHCAIPFALVLLAGLVHATFEDWLAAVGYYLCVFFWTSAFWLRDMLPAPVPAPIRAPSRLHPRVACSYETIAQNR